MSTSTQIESMLVCVFVASAAEAAFTVVVDIKFIVTNNFIAFKIDLPHHTSPFGAV
jgi:hypothetical protein